MIWRNREDDQQDVKSLHHVFHPGDFGGDSENVKFFDDHFLISSENVLNSVTGTKMSFQTHK